MFCLHKKWEMLNKPNEADGKSHCRCMKCGKVKYKKLSVNKNGRYNYMWCTCGNDLIRESIIGLYFDEKYSSDVHVYKCDMCNKISLWIFGIAPCPICVEEVYLNDKRYKEIINKLK